MKTKSRTRELEQEPERPESPTARASREKKSVTISPESVIRLMYSAIWKRPQRIPEYSVW